MSTSREASGELLKKANGVASCLGIDTFEKDCGSLPGQNGCLRRS